MKKLGALILVAIFGLVLWALPAGAEKIRLSDAQLDEITAGQLFPCGQVCVPLNKGGGVAGAGIEAFGNLMRPSGSFAAGGGTPLPHGDADNTVVARIMAQGMAPMSGRFSIFFEVPGMPPGNITFPH